MFMPNCYLLLPNSDTPSFGNLTHWESPDLPTHMQLAPPGVDTQFLIRGHFNTEHRGVSGNRDKINFQ